MLAYIQGKIIEKGGDYLIIENLGLGYRVFCQERVHRQAEIESEISLFLYQLLREDKNDLYGFLLRDELDFFELLLSVSGVGPKSALAIMDLDSMENIKTAIANGDNVYLSQVSGIGPKTAKKMILDLQDKLPQLDNVKHSLNEDLLGALVSLGYTKDDYKKIMKNINPNATLQEQIKDALKLLAQ